MKKGLHPALQWITLVSPHGRLVRVLSAKVFQSDQPHFITDPGKQSEFVGQLAKFRRRFQQPPNNSSNDSSS